MKITTGLFDNMVLQRSRNGQCDAAFEGTCAAEGTLVAIVRKGDAVLRGPSGVPLGEARGGRMAGRLRGVPAGGPYRIELVIRNRAGQSAERHAIRNVLVGDVWVLGGQSNMEGIGYLAERARPDPMVRAFYMHDAWKVALDPIHNLGEAVDPVHAELAGGQPPQRAAHVGVGPGVAFGQELFRRTGVPQGLLACAHGGTSMEQWDPAKKAAGGGSLYGALLRRVRKNGGRVAGVVWYQGESDAIAEPAPHYTRRMQALVRALRRDLRSPVLPVAMVQIGRVMTWGDTASWNAVQDQQRRLPRTIRNLAVVPSVDLDLDDGIHIRGCDQHRLGRRLAQAMCALRHVRGAGAPPIELQSVAAEGNRLSGCADVFVRFRNVAGRLAAPGRPVGFALARKGQPVGNIFSTDIEGDTVRLRTGWSAADMTTLTLHYGFGTDPVCNIVDAADRSLPVFGPVPCSNRPIAFTPFVRTLLVSRALPPAADIRTVAYPADRGACGFQARTFPGDLCDLHTDLFACAPADALVYFVARFRCAEPMKLKIGLGYDGPVRMWVDGQPRYADAKGTNPAVAEKGLVPLDAAAGEHEVAVALGANHGRAWGIYLRMIRRDVPPRQRATGTYAMPEWR